MANALSLYIVLITDVSFSPNTNLSLSLGEIDSLVSNLTSLSVVFNANASFLMVVPPSSQGINTTILGALFIRNLGGLIVENDGSNNPANTSLTAAAEFSPASLVNVISLNMLIVNKPIIYENIDSSNSTQLASAVIVIGVQRNSSVSAPVNISLFFQVLPEYNQSVNGSYLCAYYDLGLRVWNSSGCTVPVYNGVFARYECSCNHLSTFALIFARSLLSPTFCVNSTHSLSTNGSCLLNADAQVRQRKVFLATFVHLVHL